MREKRVSCVINQSFLVTFGLYPYGTQLFLNAKNPHGVPIICRQCDIAQCQTNDEELDGLKWKCF